MRACRFSIYEGPDPSQRGHRQAQLQARRERAEAFVPVPVESDRRFRIRMPFATVARFECLDAFGPQDVDVAGDPPVETVERRKCYPHG
jgi:hypothetical protein